MLYPASLATILTVADGTSRRIVNFLWYAHYVVRMTTLHATVEQTVQDVGPLAIIRRAACQTETSREEGFLLWSDHPNVWPNGLSFHHVVGQEGSGGKLSL
jgi:hypothetical protein